MANMEAEPPDLMADAIILGEYTPEGGSASARADRTMSYRMRMAIYALRDKLTGVIETIYQQSQGLQGETRKLTSTMETLGTKYDQVSASQTEIARSQSRLQITAIWLTGALVAATVAYVWITWQSVQAMRDANDIQRQLLNAQKIVRPASLPDSPKP